MNFNTKMLYGILPPTKLDNYKGKVVVGVGEIWKSTIKETRILICPVCLGKTILPKGFYPDMPSVEFPTCRSCKGKGVI